MKKQKFPPGWDERRVREVIAHYDSQTEEEQAAEIEAALNEHQVIESGAEDFGAVIGEE